MGLGSGRVYVNPIAEGRSAGASEVGIGSVPKNSHLVPNATQPGSRISQYVYRFAIYQRARCYSCLRRRRCLPITQNKKIRERVASLSQIKGHSDTSLIHWGAGHSTNIKNVSYRWSVHRRYCRTCMSPRKIQFNGDLVHPTRTTRSQLSGPH